MPVLEMEVKLPAEDVHRVIFDCIRTGHIGKKDRVKISSRPSYIEVMPGEYPMGGPVKIRITPQGDRSRIRLDVGIGIGTIIGLILDILLFTLFILDPSDPWPLIILIVAGSSLSGYTKICNRYRNKISDLLRTVERTGVIPEFKVEEEPKPPVDINALYERLIRTYSTLYGRGARMVDRKIQAYMKEGLSREEAIKRLAEEEGLLERAEREYVLELAEKKPRPKPEVEGKPGPELPPETLDALYQRLLYRYCSVYGRSRSTLERKIEEYMKGGLSREEAIRILAWEEGIA